MNFIALFAALYGAFILVSGNSAGLSPAEAIKGLGLVAVGLGYLAINFLPVIVARIRNFNFSSFLPNVKLKRVPDMPKETSQEKATASDVNIFVPQNFEIKDLECLVHLRNRCAKAGSVEGLEACEKLNAVIFKLNNPNGDKV